MSPEAVGVAVLEKKDAGAAAQGSWWHRLGRNSEADKRVLLTGVIRQEWRTIYPSVDLPVTLI